MKCHSSQHKENRLDVKNASKRTDHKEASAETIIVDLITEIILETIGQEKCTKQLAQIAANNAKYHSSQHKENQLDARNALVHLETR